MRSLRPGRKLPSQRSASSMWLRKLPCKTSGAVDGENVEELRSAVRGCGRGLVNGLECRAVTGEARLFAGIFSGEARLCAERAGCCIGHVACCIGHFHARLSQRPRLLRRSFACAFDKEALVHEDYVVQLRIELFLQASRSLAPNRSGLATP